MAPTPTEQREIDPDFLKKYAFSVWTYKKGEMVSAMLHIGDQVLDLILNSFRTGSGMTYKQPGPWAAAGLARTTGPSAARTSPRSSWTA